MTIAAVLFDFDGTLVESLDVKAAAFRALYAPFGDEIADQAVGHYRAHTGIPRRERFAFCHRTLLGRDLAERELTLLSEQFGAMVEDQVIASPWVAGAEAFLAGHDGAFPLFVVSATPQAELDRIVEARGMGDYFEEVYGSPPDKTAILHEVLSINWFDRARVVMVGDGRADAEAALANGIRFIGRRVPGGDAVFPPGTTVLADLLDLPRYLAA